MEVAQQQQQQQLDEEFVCPVCLNILLEPTTINCGHNVCRGCLAGWYLSNVPRRDECPTCRQKWEGYPQVNKTLRSGSIICDVCLKKRREKKGCTITPQKKQTKKTPKNKNKKQKQKNFPNTRKTNKNKINNKPQKATTNKITTKHVCLFLVLILLFLLSACSCTS